MANDPNSVKQHIDSASSILVCVPVNATKDVVAASLALHLALIAYSKKSTIVSSTLPIVRDSHLVGLDKIGNDVGGNNLVLTLNVPEDQIEKVTSNTEGGHLNLVVIPRQGSAPLEQKDVVFGYSGSAADLIIVVGASGLNELGSLAEKEVELFGKATIINLGNKNGTFGAINLNDSGSSNSELITALLQEMSLPLDVDIAGNLMQGIEDATDGLSSPEMTADTFEALAVLYRNGARRTRPSTSQPVAQVISDVPVVEPEQKPVQKNEIKVEKPQPDWLKPKIFKTPTAK